MNSNITSDIKNYGSLLEYLPESKIDVLKNTLLDLKRFGVQAYAERIVDINGNSIKFCNSKEWKELEAEKSFFKDYRDHFSVESLYNFKGKNKIITRSNDKINNKFLQRLDSEKLNNSIIVNDFHKDRINISYFMIDPQFPSNRDIILNNLSTIEEIRTKTQKSITEFVLLNKLCKKNLLDAKSVSLIFSSSGKKEVKLIWENNIYSFTERESDCLKLLKSGVSNKFISQFLKISLETVKFHLNNIKSKTGLQSKGDIIRMALTSRIITNS
jgi:DNA-binding CsgD family transcriptional regulator